MTRNQGISENILQLVGDTPLVKLNNITKDLKGAYFAKLESFNPGNSQKDRIALHIVENAEKKGILTKGATIVETTSGNTGYSLAMISLVKGYKCILAISDKSSQDKIDLLKTMGAEVHVCPANVPADDPRSYYEVAKTIAKKTPNSVYINQYFNELNSDAHYRTTGPEIWKQTQGKITHLVVASGTGGTISGTGRYLKEQNPNIKILGVDAYGSVLKKYHETGTLDLNEVSPYKIEGLGKNLIPTATDFDVIDVYEKVTDKDAALTAREIIKAEGIFPGYTCGAVVQATKQYAAQDMFTDDSVVVLIFPDSGSRYMNKIYNDSWMREQGFIE
ncbi:MULTISPECIES: PLP-dependent cysteine synthase family protein [unclassified Polaribacter]|uniref:PLP-dependent cysteine synthase family protein n=1 Tax=unclassified Polaribacter TaxID=196858 RepID=UPI0011BEC59A|nr:MULTISPECIES: pyridoxal-phosphate dependent enzyme [unclassified Polaribacter]TXD51303.1 pyridoxal-phosphate dependent enzyme [Polaribacter sp. IC063]TXD56592.1 pyridoxal-phosphate dependent enzyme [Polaribacter sp. IC066]